MQSQPYDLCHNWRTRGTSVPPGSLVFPAPGPMKAHLPVGPHRLDYLALLLGRVVVAVAVAVEVVVADVGRGANRDPSPSTSLILRSAAKVYA